jgi:hypothetical protein
MTALRTFLVEAYAPASSECDVLAHQMDTTAGRQHSIRRLRSILVPEDEICFHIFEAESADSLAEAVAQAEVRAQRIVEVDVTD